MAKKADLISQAESLGFQLNGKETVAQLEELIESDPNAGARNASPENPCPICGRRNPHVHSVVADVD